MKTKTANSRKHDKAPVRKSKPPAAWKLIEEYARQQGVKPLDDPKVLQGGFPPDEDIDAFLEVIYSSRR